MHLSHWISSIRQKLRGFTLVETFVAITILMAAVVGPLSIASQGLTAAQTGGDQISAVFLAQDAVEYVRAVRDTNRLTVGAANWLTALDNCISADGSKSCYFDSTQSAGVSGVIKQCPSGACPVISYDMTSGFYNYAPDIPNAAIDASADAPTKFTRTVSILYPVGTNDCITSGHGCEAALQVVVGWSTGGLAHTVKFREDLMDWE